MKKPSLALLSVFFSGLANAQLPLPKPLVLPPGLEETLAVSKAGSYFSEAVKIQDCPLDRDNPLGLCNNLLFGGMAMFISQLAGNLHIKFYTPIGNVAQFEITHPGGLHGDAAVERAPLAYHFPIAEPEFTDELRLTKGQVDLTTGWVQNLDYRLCVASNILDAYKNLNPQLEGCEVALPGIYGTAIGHFDQRPDGLLDFTFFGSTFAPLGNNQAGKGDDKVRIPLPFCSKPGVCAGMEAPGTSLRPRLRISTREPGDPDCGINCPDIPINSTVVFQASAYHSSMGDRFTHLIIPELGGPATGWSHLLGKFYIQFGDRHGDLVPVTIWATVPDGLLAEPPPSPIQGFGINMLGVDGRVKFPNDTYVATDRVWISDPFDFAVGVINVRTGRSVGDFVYRGLPYQTLFILVQELNAGRIPQDTFRFQGPATFERGPNGSLVFRYDSEVFLDFSTFLWPVPDYNLARGFRARDGSLLDPFLKFQATSGGLAATVVKSGEVNETSSFGDLVSLKYSIPCDVANKNFSFVYTNSSTESRGGTFHMDALSGVSCANARGSSAPPGEADSVSFAGYGSWSKDSNRHVVTAQINTALKYFIVQVDGGTVSNADSILKTETTP